jgi:glycerol dehydrogenase-like iron-containing ADH family enzyme
MPGEACQRPILEFPTIHYGYDLLEHIPMGDERIGVVTMEEPWELARPRFPRVPDAILFLRSMDWDTVEAAERALPVVDRVVGLGGGTSIDMAKYIGWRRHIPVDAIPSISSVDAGMTKSIAVRESGHVQYIGFVVPKNVYVDYGLIQAAPAALNRAGVGDIVSIHTALWDWAYARDEHGARYDEPTAHEVRAWLQAISDQAADIRAVSKEGIKLIFAAFAAVNKACRAFGSSQPQEGSEHTFAYNAEYVTRRTFIHGEIVSLGTLIMSMLQENDPHIVQDILERCGVRYQPRDLGLSRSEVEKILSTLNEYQKSFGRRPTVLDGRAIDDAFIRRVLNSLVFAS